MCECIYNHKNHALLVYVRKCAILCHVLRANSSILYLHTLHGLTYNVCYLSDTNEATVHSFCYPFFPYVSYTLPASSFNHFCYSLDSCWPLFYLLELIQALLFPPSFSSNVFANSMIRIRIQLVLYFRHTLCWIKYKCISLCIISLFLLNDFHLFVIHDFIPLRRTYFNVLGTCIQEPLPVLYLIFILFFKNVITCPKNMYFCTSSISSS